MKKRFLFTLIATAVMISILTGIPSWALTTGDKAPPLSISKWLNGTAVNPDKPDGKTIYVIEFWATWCGPCKKTIPHLNELNEKYKDKNVVVIGITNEDEKVVAPFVREMKMNYRVGIDDRDKTSSIYMKGIDGIPHTFIINRDGIIIWSGHPLSGLDDVLPKVLAGTYSIESVKKREQLQANLQKALDEQNMEKSVAACDEMLKDDPANQKAILVKLKLLTLKGEPQALRAARIDAVNRFSNNTEMLDRIAYDAMSCDNVQMRDMVFAYDTVKQGIALNDRKSSELLVTLAMIYKELDMLDESISSIREAIKYETDEDSRRELEVRAKYFESLKKAREEIMKKK